SCDQTVPALSTGVAACAGTAATATASSNARAAPMLCAVRRRGRATLRIVTFVMPYPLTTRWPPPAVRTPVVRVLRTYRWHLPYRERFRKIKSEPDTIVDIVGRPAHPGQRFRPSGRGRRPIQENSAATAGRDGTDRDVLHTGDPDRSPCSTGWSCDAS